MRWGAGKPVVRAVVAVASLLGVTLVSPQPATADSITRLAVVYTDKVEQDETWRTAGLDMVGVVDGAPATGRYSCHQDFESESDEVICDAALGTSGLPADFRITGITRTFGTWNDVPVDWSQEPQRTVMRTLVAQSPLGFVVYPTGLATWALTGTTPFGPLTCSGIATSETYSTNETTLNGVRVHATCTIEA